MVDSETKLTQILEAFKASVIEDYIDTFNDRMDRIITHWEASPIEKLMHVHLLASEWGFWDIDNMNVCSVIPDIFKLDKAIELTRSDGGFYLYRQLPIKQYRADFAIVIGQPYHDKNDVLKIVIECDGHDFHERTKHQASRDKKRDREMQKLGWLVFRFTGSDIYNRGEECAQEIADYCAEWYEGRVKKA